MVAASGVWAWWNPNGNVSLPACVDRAKRARLRGVIVKHGHVEARRAFDAAGIPWATERYVYPAEPAAEGRWLAEEVRAGARFAVVNAEVEWERLGPEPMRRLIAEFRRLAPRAELYASVDTRGGRTALPYQRVLAEHVAGWLAMCYPKSFRPAQPSGYVAQAFRDCLDGKSFGGKPVLPTIQTFDGIGAVAVREQIAEVRRRGLAGYQAYTIGHATDEEWEAIVETQTAEDLRALRRDFQRYAWEHGVSHAVAVLFLRAAGHALRNEPLPAELRKELRRALGREPVERALREA